MNKRIEIEKTKTWSQMVIFAFGLSLGVMQLILRLNLVSVISIAYCCIISLFIFLGIVIQKKLYLFFTAGYLVSFSGILLYYIFFGADAGFGAFSSGKIGFITSEHPLLCGYGNILTRLAGNLLIALPCLLVMISLILVCSKLTKKIILQKILSVFTSFVLIGTTIFFVLTMNLRSKPNTARLWEGQEDYLQKIDNNKTSSNSPNVLFILMDDLGYGDISANGSLINTPNIDRIAEEGLILENFYSSYSVCSPARFAALTGRYPYRGYADNVIFPTIATIKPFASTRIYNSVEMGANCDGMLGDEITIAEALNSAGYATGTFGKWHLGDYGEYLPTNQGFDYFYGTHHVNDMIPFYFVKETNAEYQIINGINELKDQKDTTKLIHNEIDQWIRDVVTNTDQPFFAYYASPKPHAPVYAGDEFKGKTGLGEYADCITEFDYYLGQLFDTLEELGELDNTIIMFTSDNGPALEGSTNNLRGSKGMVYEGGQKVPFFIRWGNNNGLFEAGTVRTQAATLTDLFPTLVEICGVSANSGTVLNYLPKDRVLDGISMVPLLKDDEVIHKKENPILYMKSGKLHSLQYSVDTDSIKDENNNHVINNHEYVSFKYFKNVQNDNPVFFNLRRKDWLILLTDDKGESYNRKNVYPMVAQEMDERLQQVMNDFKDSRRGIIDK
ncbi:MAG: sulfatase-like hydrolase/transferase [Acutalibacteraceae bacterium]